jgi:hypothetical protein
MPMLNAMEDFRRDISYHVLRCEDGNILLTATLKDRFHDIIMEVVVDTESLAVKSVGVDFRMAPSPDCPNVLPRLEKLVGLVIGKGLNRRLMELLGGGEGCGNLRGLLIGLLPLALNVKAAAGITGEQEMLDRIHNRLVGTCAGYSVPVQAHDDNRPGS